MTDIGLMVEITRLEAANEYAFGELAKLRADNERLRAALQSIHDVYDKPEYHNPTILVMLRRALEPKP